MRRTFAPLSTGLALCLPLTACGDAGERPRVTAAQQCDGVLSPAAAGALGSLLGAKVFSEAGGGGLERAVREMAEDRTVTGRPPGHRPMCEVTTADSPGRGVRVGFRLYEKDDLYDDGKDWAAQGRYLYGMGREASADGRSAHLFVGCSSPRLKGSEKEPAPLQGTITFEGTAKAPRPGDTPATREAYLTVLHSVTLAVVRELGCENDAGLPGQPVLRAKKWRGEKRRGPGNDEGRGPTP